MKSKYNNRLTHIKFRMRLKSLGINDLKLKMEFQKKLKRFLKFN
jgi:hypothetical protein